jgi:uncharacterized DUF497 family protein
VRNREQANVRAGYRLYGRIRGRLFVVVYTVRSRTVQIISARKANARTVTSW